MRSTNVRSDKSLRSATEAFWQIEKDLDLFEERIDGVRFWERIRFPVHHRLMRGLWLHGQADTEPPRDLFHRSRARLRALAAGLSRNPYFASPRDILFFGSARRKLRHDGKWWDIYCDPLIEHLDTPYLYIERPYLHAHMGPARTKDVRYLDFPYLLASTMKRAGLCSILLSRQERLLCRAIGNRLEQDLDVRIDIAKIVVHDLEVRKSRLPIYRMLLRRARPKLTVIVTSYGKETFIESCKELDIPVAELQHGIIHRFHLGYNYAGPHAKKVCFPDYLLLFGDFWKKDIEYPLAPERIHVVGYPYLEDEARRYRTVDRKEQVVFISGGHIGKPISEFAVAFQEAVGSGLDVVYKLHPGEYSRWRTEYPWLASSSIRVVEDDQTTLYQLLAESKVQVGVNSTAIYEGLAFGLQTVLLDLPGLEVMERLVEEGVASVASSSEELVHAATSGQLGTTQADLYFQRNALARGLSAMQEILDRRGE